MYSLVTILTFIWESLMAVNVVQNVLGYLCGAKLKNYSTPFTTYALRTHASFVHNYTNHTQGLREGGSGGTSYPGPSLGGPGLKGPVRVRVSVLSFGITPKHPNQTCLQQKYQSSIRYW